MTAFRIVIAAFVGLWSISALAQVPTPAANNPNGPDQTGQTTGGTNQTQGNSTDPYAQKNANDPNAQKNDPGPCLTPGNRPHPVPILSTTRMPRPNRKLRLSIPVRQSLSRGISSSEPMNPKNIEVQRPRWAWIMCTIPACRIALQPNGTLATATASGIQLTYGLTGTKVYKKDIFSLSFKRISLSLLSGHLPTTVPVTHWH